MRHPKFNEVKVLVQNNINVLLTGEAGTGKTTLLKQVAEELGLDFYSVTGTRQTTLNSLLGFLSINGNYIESQFRLAVEHGGMFLISEIDGMDPNVLLALNTLENNFMSFPDKVVIPHKDFRLVADANPQDQHQIYTGRSKLDAATLSRFDVVELPLDKNLEVALTSSETVEEIRVIRELLVEMNASKTISMRDTIRLHKRKQLGLADNYHKILLGSDELTEIYNTRQREIEASKPKPLSECGTIDQLWDNLSTEPTTINKPILYYDEIVPDMKLIAKHIARLWVQTGNIQEEHISDGWIVASLPDVEDPYGKTVKVSRIGYTTVYRFNIEELKQ